MQNQKLDIILYVLWVWIIWIDGFPHSYVTIFCIINTMGKILALECWWKHFDLLRGLWPILRRRRTATSSLPSYIKVSARRNEDAFGTQWISKVSTNLLLIFNKFIAAKWAKGILKKISLCSSLISLMHFSHFSNTHREEQNKNFCNIVRLMEKY